MPDNSVAIANLEALINSATSSAKTEGGEAATFDLDFALKRLAALKASDTTGDYETNPRPRVASINLSRG